MADDIKQKTPQNSSSIFANNIAIKIARILREQKSPYQAAVSTIRQQIKV